MLMSVAFNNPSPKRKHYLIETEDESSEDEVSRTHNQPWDIITIQYVALSQAPREGEQETTPDNKSGEGT